MWNFKTDQYNMTQNWILQKYCVWCNWIKWYSLPYLWIIFYIQLLIMSNFNFPNLLCFLLTRLAVLPCISCQWLVLIPRPVEQFRGKLQVVWCFRFNSPICSQVKTLQNVDFLKASKEKGGKNKQGRWTPTFSWSQLSLGLFMSFFSILMH